MNQSQPDQSLSPGISDPVPVLRPGYERLSRCLLNRDSAGMIEERLPQELMAMLNCWSSDPDEWDGGRPLTLDAPLFDAFLGECLMMTGAADMAIREQCWFLFVLGLWLGSELRPAGDFETSVSFDEVLRRLGQLGHADLPPAAQIDQYFQESMCIRTELTRCAPELERLVLAGFRLARANPQGPADPHATFLFLFVLGLIGAGVDVPWEGWEGTPEPRPGQADARVN